MLRIIQQLKNRYHQQVINHFRDYWQVWQAFMTYQPLASIGDLHQPCILTIDLPLADRISHFLITIIIYQYLAIFTYLPLSTIYIYLPLFRHYYQRIPPALKAAPSSRRPSAQRAGRQWANATVEVHVQVGDG